MCWRFCWSICAKAASLCPESKPLFAPVFEDREAGAAVVELAGRPVEREHGLLGRHEGGVGARRPRLLHVSDRGTGAVAECVVAVHRPARDLRRPVSARGQLRECDLVVEVVGELERAGILLDGELAEPYGLADRAHHDRLGIRHPIYRLRSGQVAGTGGGPGTDGSLRRLRDDRRLRLPAEQSQLARPARRVDDTGSQTTPARGRHRLVDDAARGRRRPVVDNGSPFRQGPVSRLTFLASTPCDQAAQP